MKIKSLRLNNYKRFKRDPSHPFEFNFFNPDTGEVNDITLIIGNNGEGKSSILQAIASLLGGAILDKFRPSDLIWPGFVYPYLQNGRYPVVMEADLVFGEDEVNATRAFCAELMEILAGTDRVLKMPPQQNHLTLRLDHETDKVLATQESGMDSFFLTKGYQYAKQLESKSRNYGSRFDRVGSILWYDEHRTSASITKYLFKEDDEKNAGVETGNRNEVKKLIERWYYAHVNLERGVFQLRPGQFDKFKRLKEMYELVFSGRQLRGATMSQGGGNGLDIVFFDGTNEYDFNELSAGERAIFPILLDFANQNINNSIILIDEIELHLHPPLQQILIKALPRLGKNNQFIVTTHSNIVASMFEESQIIRLS